MNYSDWIKKEFWNLSQSLGFHFVPGEEIENRIKRIRERMARQGIEAILVIEKMDFYYLSGTTQEGFLFLPLEGKPLLLIKRELERAKIESPLKPVIPLQSIRHLPLLIQDHYRTLPQNLGLEFDLLPVRDYFRYQDLFSGTVLLDSSAVFREVRKIKSPFEMELMKKAGEIARKVYEEAKGMIQEGMTEIELGGLLEAVAKKYGHEGLLRVRSLNYEAYSWHILSGSSGGVVSQSDSPMGGFGLSPAFPVGASLKKIKAREPILVDFGICYHGYQVDQTRMFSIGRMKKRFIDAYKASKEIHDSVLDEVHPGTDCEALFKKTVRLAKKLGYGDSYLGPPRLQTRFVGHGIGLELNELPFLAQGHSYPLEEGMTFAIEPKIVFPGEGAVGFENTVAVTQSGYEILTPIEQAIFQV